MKTFYKYCLLLLSLSFFAFTAQAASDDSIFTSVPASKNPQQEQSINLVKTYFTSFNKKDLPTFFSTLSSDVVHDLNQGKTEKGRKAFEIFMEMTADSFDEKLDHIVILVSDDGKYAAAKWVDHGTYVKDSAEMDIKAKNQKFVVPGGHFFEIRDGKITRVTTYFNVPDFMKQIKG